MPPPLSYMKTIKEASAVCRSFLDGVVIFIIRFRWHLIFKNSLAHSKVIWKKLVLYLFLKIPYFRKLNFSKGIQNSILKYIYKCLISENDRPIYVDSKNYYISCIFLYVFQKVSVPHSCQLYLQHASVCDGC